MGNSYYSRMYGRFKPFEGREALNGQDKFEFIGKWNKTVNRLKDSGYDLSKIKIIPKR